jgi:orotate phosphoribosyltransferase
MQKVAAGNRKEFRKEDFRKFILENGVVGFFSEPITLKSGRKSSWYVNWRTVARDDFLTDQLSDYVLAFARAQGLCVDCFYGVPEGATKLGILTQYKHAMESDTFTAGSHPLAMGRSKPKEHGAPEDRFFVGMPRGNTIVIEDVTTTGGSLITTIQQLQEARIVVTAAIGLTNRMELRDDRTSVADAIAALGVTYLHMSDATELLPEAYQKLQPGEAIALAIEEEFARFGIKPLRLLATGV